MASIIKIKRSTTQSAVPGSLETGEIAVNLFDRKLYVGNSTGVTAISGETYSVTSQAATAGAGAYIKVNGETSSNSVLLEAGTDLDIARQANGSILFELEDTISSNTTGSAATLTTARAIQLSGDVTGTANFDGSAGINISTTIAADSVALGTDTTGNYLASISASNSSVVITSGSGEGATPTVALGDNIGANTSGTAATATALATARNIGAVLTGDVTGQANVSFDGTGNAQAVITTTIAADSVALGTDTTGNFVAGISATANETSVSGSGSENATVTVGLADNVTIPNNLTVTGNTAVQGNIVVDGNLTVEGGVTYISSSTVNVDDSMLKLSANNAADTVDTGVYAKYVVSGNSAVQYAGYFRDAGDGTFKFYTGLDVEPTTTVDTTDTGYGLAQVDAIIDGGTY